MSKNSSVRVLDETNVSNCEKLRLGYIPSLEEGAVDLSQEVEERLRKQVNIAFINSLNEPFYCVNTSYPMDNCFTGRRDRSRQTPEKDVLYILPAGPVTDCAFARWRIVLHFLFTS